MGVDGDFAFLEQTFAGGRVGRFHAEAKHVAAEFQGRKIELHGHRLAVAAESNLCGVDLRALSAAKRIVGRARPSRQSNSTVTLWPFNPKPSMEPSTEKRSPGKTRGGHVERDHADAGRLFLGSDADRKDGNVRFAGHFLGRVGDGRR